MNVRRERAWRAVGVAGLLVLMALQLVHVVRATSATWDEPHHLFDGYMVWTEGDYRLNPEVPPLVKMVAALPLMGRGLAAPANHGWSSPKEAFLDGREFVFRNGVERTLDRGRLACVGFTLGLGLLIFLWVREAFGYWGALFALAMYCFDPNFLAHGALVTTDVGSACLFVGTVYGFWRYCRKRDGMAGWRWLMLTGLSCGLLLAAKFTGVFIAPMLLLLAMVEGVRARSWRVLGGRVAAVLAVGVLGLVVLWGFYGFRYKAGPAGTELNPTLSAYLGRMYDRKDAGRLAVAAKYKVLPEAYLWGLENTKQTEFEDNSYYLGRVFRHGNRGYFVVAMLVKSTVPFLVMVVIGVWITIIRWRHGRTTEVLRSAQNDGVPSRDRLARWWFVLAPALLYFAVASASDFDIGVRHVLPVYAFLYMAIGGVAAALLRWDVRWGWVLAGLVGWQVVTSVRVAPAYMAYGNEAMGGPGVVRRYLSDANVDWGQQLKGVKRYLDEHNVKECWFAYFPDGAIEPGDYGISCKRLPTTSAVWWLDLKEDVPPVIEGTVLVSDGLLEGIEFGDGPVLNPYESFRGMKPDAVIEGGVYVYTGRFVVPLASALVTAHEADKLLAAGKVSEALIRARVAAGLAPESAPVEMTLGNALTKAGDASGAEAAYARGLASAEKVRPELQEGWIKALRAKVGGAQ